MLKLSAVSMTGRFSVGVGLVHPIVSFKGDLNTVVPVPRICEKQVKMMCTRSSGSTREGRHQAQTV